MRVLTRRVLTLYGNLQDFLKPLSKEEQSQLISFIEDGMADVYEDFRKEHCKRTYLAGDRRKNV